MPTSMNDAPTVLEYEVTADDLHRYVRDLHTRLQRRWTRRIAGLVALLMGLYFAADGVWLAAALCLLLWTYYWFGWVYWLIWCISSRFVAVRGPYQCRIEVDHRGLVMTAPRSRSRQRFWWRNLHSVEDKPEDLELDFGGGMVLCIPRKAFANAEHYAEFRAQVHDRLASRGEVAATR
jgi:hypothetical protein